MNPSNCVETSYSIIRLKDLFDATMPLQDKLISAYVKADGGQLAKLEELCKRLNSDIASLLLFRGKIEEIMATPTSS